MSDSLRMEVKQFGIDVIVIEPGSIKSEWKDIAIGNLQKTSVDAASAYKEGATAFFNATKKIAEEKSSEPSVIVDLICQAIEAKSPKTRYAGGFMAKPALLMRKILSDKLLDKVILSQMKPSK